MMYPIKYAKISISEDGVWAGDGIINICIIAAASHIYDCGASFGDPDQTEAVYEAIEAAIAHGKSSVEHNGSRYSWTISEQLRALS